MKSLFNYILIILCCLSISFIAAQNEEPKEGEPERKRPGGNRGKMFERLKAMDIDQDGQISREEYQGPERLFDRLDKNQDGYIHLESEMNNNRGQKRDGNRKRPKLDNAAIFALLDTNEDGVVSREEFMAQDIMKVIRQTRKGGQRGQRGERNRGNKKREGMLGSNFIEKFDKDNDGKVAMEELPEMMRSHFGKFDKNGDGMIDGTEIEAVRKDRLNKEAEKPVKEEEDNSF